MASSVRTEHVELETSLARELIPDDAVVERISSGHLFVEGPVWDAGTEDFRWSDIAGDTIWSWTERGGPSVFLRPSHKSNGLTLDREGRLIVAGWTDRSVWRLEHDRTITKLVTHHEGVRIGTPNDIVMRSDGSIYWTDGTSGARHPGFETAEDLQIYRRESVVMRWDPRSNASSIVTDQCGSCNGIAFSADEKTLYVNDSSARLIYAFDVSEDGKCGARRLFREQTGSAMKADRDGNLWTTGDGGIHLLDASGRLHGRIFIPEKPSNLAWGPGSRPGWSEHWSTLFVTAQTSVYRVRLRARGVPVGIAARWAS